MGRPLNSKNKRPDAIPSCHPDRRYHAKGLCQPCYKNQDKYRITDVLRKRRQTLEPLGLTLEDYENEVIKQSGVCAICHGPQREGVALAIDHDHTSGKFRGLLCDGCNRGLGDFKDNILALEAAIKYLKERR